MAVTNTELKEQMKIHIKESMKSVAIPINEKAIKKEGTGNIDEYLKGMQEDFLGGMGVLNQTLASTVFQPVLLDPNVYDQGTLYGLSPFLSYLEAKGRRAPAGSTKQDYIQMTSGISEEWIAETAATQGTSDYGMQNAHAFAYVEAIPLSFSDLMQYGQGASSKAQMMGFAQEALREGLNKALLTGDNSGSSNTQMDGLFTIAAAHGIRSDKSNNSVQVADLDKASADLSEQRKGYATAVVTTETVLNQIKADMTNILKVNMPTYDVQAGLRIPAYTGPRGDVPIIVDPYTPNTAGSRRVGMFNERHIFIKDLINNAWVEKGKTKPVATDGWMVQCTMMYHVSPTQIADIYDIT